MVSSDIRAWRRDIGECRYLRLQNVGRTEETRAS